MTLDEKTNLEYVLLRNYLELTNPARGLLLKMDFDALEKIDSNSWLHKFEGESEDVEKSKRMVKSMIQQEIIAKIMIYIEDLTVISESLLRGVNYYSLLDKKKTKDGIQDVGDILKKFFENVDKFSEIEISKIMSYGKKEDYASNEDEKQLLSRAIVEETKEIKRIFKIMKDFGKDHHSIFRRYKHAGFPQAPGLRLIKPLPEYLKNFDFISFVSINEDPFYEPKIIPYSKKVISSYHIIIHGIQTILKDIVDNKKAEIQREKSLPPICWHTAYLFSSDERKKFDEILHRYDAKFPTKNTDYSINMTSKSESAWYSNLETFLEECKEIQSIDDEYRNSLSS